MLNPWLLFIHKSDSPDRMTKWNNFIVTLNNTTYSVIIYFITTANLVIGCLKG